MNQQPIEKSVKSDGRTLDVHSIFYTLQGEGPFCGRPAVFVRLAGCNLQCPLCDTAYTEGRQMMSVNDIIERVAALRKQARLVVITGGEPFRQNLTNLCVELTAFGFMVQIETNGTLLPQEIERFRPLVHIDATSNEGGVYIVCSPKTGKVNPYIRMAACAFKYVARADKLLGDGLPGTALDHTAEPYLCRPPRDALVYLQPADEKDDERNARNVDAVVSSCLQNGFALQLQVHKLVNLE